MWNLMGRKYEWNFELSLLGNTEIKMYIRPAYIQLDIQRRTRFILQSELVHLNENDRVGRQSIFDFFLRFLFQWVLYSQNYSFKQSVPVCNQRQINDRFGTNNVSIVQAVSMNTLFFLSFILITKIFTLLLSPLRIAYVKFDISFFLTNKKDKFLSKLLFIQE